MSVIADEFASYLAAVTPEGETFSEVQVTEMRRAFYAGAFATLTQVERIGTDDVSEDESVAILEGLLAEVRQYLALVRSGQM